MRIGLFVPCYVDQLRPSVARATLRILERLGHEVDFPAASTCCGQPHLNSGSHEDARALARRFIGIFEAYDRVVCPSASCVATVTRHYRGLLGDVPGLAALEQATCELSAFLVDVHERDALSGKLKRRVGIHPSCHALRGLRQGVSSEADLGGEDPVRVLVNGLEGVEIAELERRDECCGFGGAFTVEEGAVSRLMGVDRLRDHQRAGAQIVTSTDVSCLIHLEGIARREGMDLEFLHVVELLERASA